MTPPARPVPTASPAPAAPAAPAAPEQDDRRRRILDAALAEFAARGFASASTNAIAQQAGVAKGLVFHHFRSKEELFLAVNDDVISRLVPLFDKTIAEAPQDLFARIFAWTEVKLRLVREDPQALRFFLVASTEAPEPVRSQARERSEALLRSLMPRFFEGLDTSKLRAGVTPEEAMEALWLLSAGFERQLLPLLSASKDASLALVEGAIGRAKRMFEILRDSLYR